MREKRGDTIVELGISKKIVKKKNQKKYCKE